MEIESCSFICCAVDVTEDWQVERECESIVTVGMESENAKITITFGEEVDEAEEVAGQ